MNDNITGKVIVITGASSGMGEAAARHRADVQKLVDTAVHTYGRIDVLINNAGVMPLPPTPNACRSTIGTR